MPSSLRRLILPSVAAFLAALPVTAQAAPDNTGNVQVAQATAQRSEAGRGMRPLSAEDRAVVKRVEDYLNSIDTLEARFSQVDSQNTRATGKIYLSRPGRLRFEYDPPVPVLIVANGRFLIHYDRDLKTASYINQRDTPAWFLLSPTVELRGDVTVTDVQRQDGKALVTIIKTSEPDQGRVTLVLEENPMRLVQWAVSDAQGVVTYVSLQDAEFGKPIDTERFQFDEPVWTDQ